MSLHIWYVEKVALQIAFWKYFVDFLLDFSDPLI